MSRAYCLTCNEHVHETPSGTCPLGHPVAPDGYGPEPWVGFAGDTETDVAGVQMQHLDASGRPREHAGVGQHVNGTRHVDGAANGSSNGHASLTSSSVPFPAVNGSGNGSRNGSDRPAASDLASDDLAALLADALRENVPDEQPATSVEPATPVDEAPTSVEDPAPAVPASPVADDDADWGELASLAAELQLDEHVATDDGPRAPEPEATTPAAEATTPAPEATPAPEPHPAAPADAAPGGELSASSIDDLLAELTGGTPDTAPPAPAAPVETDRTPGPPAADEVAAWDTPPPPPVAPPSVTPPPPPPPAVDETVLWDAPAPDEGVGSAPAADPADIWAEAEPAPAEESTPAPVVDLSNFTARGKRVGDTGSALPTRKKRGRKR